MKKAMRLLLAAMLVLPAQGFFYVTEASADIPIVCRAKIQKNGRVLMWCVAAKGAQLPGGATSLMITEDALRANNSLDFWRSQAEQDGAVPCRIEQNGNVTC